MQRKSDLIAHFTDCLHVLVVTDKPASYQTGQHPVDLFNYFKASTGVILASPDTWVHTRVCWHEARGTDHKEGGSIIISHYIIHGGYCQDINHCCRKWLNNCHKSQLNTIHHLYPPFPINILYVEMTRVVFFFFLQHWVFSVEKMYLKNLSFVVEVWYWCRLILCSHS